ncbi:MAG: sigma-70 family RNA polymerase sigma factor [Acidobacteriota bacterium]
MTDPPSEITHWLDRWSSGDNGALEALMPLVHDQLRGLARAQLARETPGHTLQPTALVHEAYLHLVGRRTVNWRSRAHFLNAVASLMRRILVDHARARRASKRGRGEPTVLFDDGFDLPATLRPDLVELDDALTTLAAVDPRRARIVELRFFAGLTEREIAEVLDVSEKTIQRDWKIARLWLLRELSNETGTAQS